MTADLHQTRERPLDRRSGNDRRIATSRRRRSDRDELIPVDDEDAVRHRMLGRSETSRLLHVAQPGPEHVIPFDEFAERPPRLLARWWALLRGLGSRR